MKTYEKPALYAESFELMDHIAGDCSSEYFEMATHRSLEKGCALDVNREGDVWSGDLVFTSKNGCNFYIIDDRETGGICYQGTFMTDGSKAFAS